MARAQATVARPALAPSTAIPAPPHGWGETLLLVAVGAAVMLVLTLPAFRSYFFAEDFMYVGQLRAHGDNFWRAVFSPTDNIFFRPVFCAVNLLNMAVLPLDPFVHHVRNWLFSALDLLLLYRILLRLVSDRLARILGLAFFAVSKVHLTAIGYINVYDSIISLGLLLATVLCFLRFAAERRTRNYVLGLLFCFLSVFTKDYGLVVVGVIGALVAFQAQSPTDWRAWWRWWLPRLAPLPGMVVVYLALRYVIVGLVPASSAAYSPQLSLDVSLHKVKILLATLGNVSLDSGTSGNGGLGSLLASRVSTASSAPLIGDGIAFVVLLALLAVTLWQGRRAGWALLFPLVWIAAYFGPTLLTRNIQMYYLYEALAGAAVLLALCLDRADRRLRQAWVVALVVIAANGLVSNYTSLYTWQFVANAAQQADGPLVVAHRGEPLDSVTFITRSRPLWEHALSADGKGPLLPSLLHRPGLAVRFVDYDALPALAGQGDRTHLFFDVDNGFVAYDPGSAHAAPLLRALVPPEVPAGDGFNVQPGGDSALAVTTEGATRGTSVVLTGRRLPTTFVSAEYLTALVPPEMLREPGRYPVYLDDGVSQSNQLEFVVQGDAPALLALRPARTGIGQGFNNQPFGPAQLVIDCTRVEVGTTVMFGSTPLVTVDRPTCPLTVPVPLELYSQEGQYDVYLVHNGVESNHLPFAVGQ